MVLARGAGVVVIGAMIGGAGARVPAQAEPAFYAGKTISLVIGSGEAGVYDLGGRLMARYLKKYIPGAPNVIPRNMPGASSIVAAEYLANVASRDGLTIATVQPTIVLNKILDSGAKYEPPRLQWIGRVEPVALVGVSWTASGVTRVEQAREREVVVSASGATGTSAIVPWALNRLIGTRFNVVRGYESQRPQFLAMERGEVAGVGSAALSDVLENADWLANKRVALLYMIAQRRSPLAPDTPSIVELATSEDDARVLSLLGSVTDVGQTLMAPPDAPAARLDILRQAFDAMVRDPEFVAEAAKLRINVNAMGGADLQRLIAATSAAPPAVVERLRAATQPQ